MNKAQHFIENFNHEGYFRLIDEEKYCPSLEDLHLCLQNIFLLNLLSN